MKKYFKIFGIILSILLIKPIQNFAQSVGLGAMRHQSINGMHLYYTHKFPKTKWAIDLSTRIAINTYKWNQNKQEHIFYQTGYANTLGEHFSLNIRPQWQAYNVGKFQFSLMANINVAYNSLKNRSSMGYGGATHTIYWKPAMVYEITIGPQIEYNFSDKWSIKAVTGFGIIHYRYNDDSGWDLTGNNKVSYGRLSNNPNKDRGDNEFIGLGDPPIVGLFVNYKLW